MENGVRMVWAGLFLAFASACARATVIDFETLAHDDDSVVSIRSFEHDGYRFTSDIDPVLADTAFGSWGTLAPDFNGSTALFNSFAGAATTLSRVDDRPFRLAAMSVGPLVAGIGGSVTFVGDLATGGQVSRTVDFGPDLAPVQVAFDAAFSGLSEVSWVQESAVQAHQFDDVVVYDVPAVPEVATASLLFGGLCTLALLGSRRGRRRVSVSSHVLP
ncbi:MAG: hypothetical protein GC151_02800 [Betaproteobacteria bacterium]|nr:hypothetical protein [Betaproteobacteria bacterium]